MLTLILIVGCCGAALGADSTTAPPPATSTVAPTAAPTAAPTTTGMDSFLKHKRVLFERKIGVSSMIQAQ